LAYDGSPKSREALFLADLLVTRWELPLVLLYVLENNRKSEALLDEARELLSDPTRVTFESCTGKPEEVILQRAEEHGADLILMGGFTASPWIEVLFGSTVERILRSSTIPLLICR
jgi:nucleotide-binding universal stress UspA family protein